MTREHDRDRGVSYRMPDLLIELGKRAAHGLYRENFGPDYARRKAIAKSAK